MIVILWVVTALTALGFLAAGARKLRAPSHELRESMEWVNDIGIRSARAIAAAEILGALGLTLPAATGIAAWLTPTAGYALAALMAGAVTIHLRRAEAPTSAVAFLTLAIICAIGWTIAL